MIEFLEPQGWRVASVLAGVVFCLFCGLWRANACLRLQRRHFRTEHRRVHEKGLAWERYALDLKRALENSRSASQHQMDQVRRDLEQEFHFPELPPTPGPISTVMADVIDEPLPQEPWEPIVRRVGRKLLGM